jgi:hypothetical protein
LVSLQNSGDFSGGIYMAINIYDFVQECLEQGLSAEEAESEYAKMQEEIREDFYERYYNDPLVCEGFAQQDVIDMYRRER